MVDDLRYAIRNLVRSPSFAVAACYVPARRASKLEPLTALRVE